jgi:hypothetical protein
VLYWRAFAGKDAESDILTGRNEKKIVIVESCRIIHVAKVSSHVLGKCNKSSDTDRTCTLYIALDYKHQDIPTRETCKAKTCKSGIFKSST